MTGTHQEHVYDRRLRAHEDLRRPPIDLGLRARVGHQWHERLDLADPPASLGDIPIDLALRDIRVVLLDQPLPDPPGDMPLLARRLQIILEPPISAR